MTTPGPILPALPDWPPANLVMFSRSQWALLGKVLAQLHDEHEAIMQVLGQFSAGVESLMTMPTTLGDIQKSLAAAATESEAADAALKTEVGTLKTSVDGLIAAFQKHAVALDPAVAADLEANIARVVAASTDLATSTTALGAEQKAVDTANPPV